MKKILVPIDESANALRGLHYAAGLARANPAVQLDLLHVLDPTKSRPYSALSSGEMTRLAPEEFVRSMSAAREFLDAEGIPYEVHCRMGDPASQIIDHLAESAIAAVVMGTRGHGLMGNLLLGSVASRVVRYAQVPVTLIK
jgi:nucleotide-binding universal stress UspA family protein